MTTATRRTRLTPTQLIATRGKRQARDAARARCWAEADLRFLLHSGQRELVRLFKEQRDPLAVWNIARRYGKSYAACVLATEVALATPEARIPYAASTTHSLKQFIYPIFRKIIATAPAHLRPEIVAGAGEIRFKNGSVIVLQGCEDRMKANRLRGPKADLVIIDEAAFIAVLDYVREDVLLPQLLTTGGKMLVCSTPPESPAHYFVKLAAQAEARGIYYHRTIHDAPHITPDQLAAMLIEFGGATSIKWRREFLAEFLVDPISSLVPEFSEHEKTIVIAYPRPRHYDRYTIGDIGFVDLTAFLFASYDFNSSILSIEDELFLERSTSFNIIEQVVDKETELWPDPLPPFATHTRLVDAQPITRADLSTQTKSKEFELFFGKVNNNEPEAAVNGLRTNIAVKIRINPKCKNLIAHLRHGTWNTTRTKFARSEGLGHSDGVAACMYLNRHTDWQHNPNPPNYINTENKHVPASLQTPYFPDAKAMRAHAWKNALSARRERR